ncbi:hypothetical protein OP10G_1111 [Fimbriimonas ginsengisoli Gsoil 348]|uniref:Apiosidase-like catalytic domain-containing protein n=2 Tax=Fimbriimonas ginsengisoli TaxID=1005039 RepID=A0A068NS97_FIMGI|nr:hypothetical protein OP10G_1111 [Fimbriimonas ginsengisoli Gsoil 348]
MEEAEHYLRTRAGQGFNVIQAVALAELDGIRTPNYYGDLPLVDQDPTRLNEPYWRHIDEVVDLAAELGLYVALLPTWGDKINRTVWGAGPLIFDKANAREFGRLVAQRYGGRDNVIWVNGGDRDPGEFKSTWRALAAGLREGDDSAGHLMTFHPCGEQSSADHFHDEKWLDMNMLQTGHGARDLDFVAEMTRKTYRRTPTKPVLDGEPRYENHPIGFDMRRGYYDDGDARQAAYAGVFCGGCGVTYGCHAIWQFAGDRHDPVNNPISHWRYSLGLPGAGQMRHLKELMLSLPFLRLAPFQVGSPFKFGLATAEGDAAAVYFAEPGTLEVAGLPSGSAEWFDPTTGHRRFAEPDAEGMFHTPDRGGRIQDWVLLIAAR